MPFEETNFYKCYNIESWDSLKTANHLIGTWRWDSTKCPTLAFKRREAENYKLVFHPNSQLDIYKGNILHQKVSWYVEGENNTYNIHTKPQVDNVYGKIFTCNQNLVLYNSLLDGNDYYYTKTEE